MTASLSDFVRSALREKGLTPNDVHLRSRGAISGGYVSDILNQKTINPSVMKLQALAVGLGVPEEQLFRVARGLPVKAEQNPTREKLIEFLDRIDLDKQQAYWELLERFHRLLPGRQRDLLKILEVFDAPEIAEIAETPPRELPDSAVAELFAQFGQLPIVYAEDLTLANADARPVASAKPKHG